MRRCRSRLGRLRAGGGPTRPGTRLRTGRAGLHPGFAASRSRRGLGDRGAGQHLHLGVTRKQEKTIGVATGSDVQIHIVAEYGVSDYRVLLVLCGELRERVIQLAVDNGVFFNPTDLVFLRLDLEEAPAVFEHLERLPVFYFGDAIRDRRDTVVEIHLAGRNIDGVMLLLAQPAASTHNEYGKECQPRRESDSGSVGGGNRKHVEARQHSGIYIEDSTGAGLRVQVSGFRS